MTAFDPWDTITPTATKIAVGKRHFSKTLYDRANKRVPDVVRTSGRTFTVIGNDKFNDTYPQYDVTWQGGDSYDCACYSLNHGESRAKKTCSHVLAVMIYREGLGHTVDDSRNGDTTHQLQLVGEEPVSNLSGGGAASVRGSDVTVPSITDTRWVEWDSTPLPGKFQALRPHQWDAIEEVMDCYARGVEVVYLDAPVGSGKSLVGDMVRRLSKQRAFYLCHTISLQNQLVADFTYARLLKGRANYPTLNGPSDTNCADCTSTGPDDACMWCDDLHSCPYQVAKSQALQAKFAVLNTSYFLTEFNWVGNVGKGRELGIIDECDVLENSLMGFVEFYLGERMLNKIGTSAPKEGSHYTTLGKWLVEEFKPRLHEYAKTIRGDDLRTIRERMSCARLMSDVLRIEQQVARDETLDGWVRDNREGPFVLKPVVVSDYGDKYVWSHAKKWLCMSATIISADELSDSCGLTGGDGEGQQGRRWEVVTVPMTFPVENRRIIVAPVADMSKKGKDRGEWEHAVTAVRSILHRHPGERVLIHSVSYELARFVVDRLHAGVGVDRPVYTYTESGSRDLTLAKFRRDQRSVLVAPSMDRGVDLADDDCRVIVVLKVPYPYLGDPQVGKRMHLPGGQQWYCTSPDTRLLTRALEWVPCAKIEEGQELLAFDEDGPWRQWRVSTVESTGTLTRPCYRLHLEDGTSLISSSEHLWLTWIEDVAHWKTTEELAQDRLHPNTYYPHRIIKVIDTWDTDTSWEAGYLAAAFDGEGHLSQSRVFDATRSKFQLGYSQRPNEMADEVYSAASLLGFRLGGYDNTRDDCLQHTVLGGKPEVLRFLGQVRPRRLLAHYNPHEIGGLWKKELVGVIGSEFLGEQEVVGMKTSTGTFIAEGFASHNSVQTVRKLVQMTGRAVRHERDTCTTYILDRQFVSNLWKKNRGLFPKWWSEALDMKFNIRELLRETTP